jgi:hypothetical protein
MGIEPVLINRGISDPHNNLLHSKIIRLAMTESAPTPSLRDLISNEEIAALLSAFPLELKDAALTKLKKRRTNKRSQAKPAHGRLIHAKP